jgi:uroporphyrinogen decarboxylase
MICILEPSSMFVSLRAFKCFSGPYVRQIVDALHATPEDPMLLLHVCGNSKHLVKAMCDTGVQGLSLDAPMDMVTTIEAMPEDVVLVGNVDPVSVMVQSSPEQVTSETRDLLEAMAPYPNFILSTGCDLPPETSLANIDAFMRAGRGG